MFVQLYMFPEKGIRFVYTPYILYEKVSGAGNRLV